MIRIALLTLCCLAGLARASDYTSLEELMLDMNRRQVEAIRAYMAANPEAEDLSEARERLIYGLVSIDDHDGALKMLEEAYAGLPEDKTGLELDAAFGEIVVPMIQLYRLENRKEDAAAFIDRVRADFKNHEMADTINEALDEFAGMFSQPGPGEILDIAFTAIDGREINLADMKGKVVLVDFWATWCVPCLKAMPGLKAVYDEFSERGFEIVGISLDSDREKLESYIEKEALAWPHYFDGKGWENDIAARYGIESIPSTFLIGPDGTIAATDLNETDLREQVAALLATTEKAPAAGE